MTEVQRTALDWARDIARAYRWALRAADPDRCAKLDAQARELGQNWIAPTYIPAGAAEEAMHAVLSPKDIAALLGVPAGTIYGWASKGLLKPSAVDEKGEPFPAGAPAKYLVKDVLDVEARRRVKRPS